MSRHDLPPCEPHSATTPRRTRLAACAIAATALVATAAAVALPPSADAPSDVRTGGVPVSSVPTISLVQDGAGSTAGPARPVLPRLLDVDGIAFFVAGRGRTLRVPSGGDLQDAIDDARPGDQILLARGGVYNGRFRLRRKANRDGRWITIRTDLAGDTLAGGMRMTPDHARRLRLATIVGTGPAISDHPVGTEPGAAGYRMVDLEITIAPTIQRMGTLVRFGHNDQRRLEDVPTDFVLDRSWVHGSETQTVLRCVLLNSAATAVLNSTLDECHAKGFDNVAIGGVAGPGPYKIVNNYLAGAGMGIFFGGADPKIPGLIPSDLEIRHNHVTRPAAWKGRWTVKNLLELKNARRVLIEGNVFEHNWVDGQAGPAIVLKSVNQAGRAPWSQTSDVTFRYNVVRSSPAGISIAGKPERHAAVPVARIAVEDNLLYDIGNNLGTRNGRMLVLGGPLTDITVARNTMLHNAGGTLAVLLDKRKPSHRVAIVGNLFTRGRYGVWASGAKEGVAALEAAWPGSWTFRENVVIASRVPRGAYPGPASSVVVDPAITQSLAQPTTWSDLSKVAQTAGGGRAGVDLQALAGRLAGVSDDFAATPRARRVGAQR